MLRYLLLILLLSGCGESKLSPLYSGDVVLAFGDSLTYGVGASKGNSYPDVLAQLTELTVINSGISGETTSQGVKRFKKVLEEYQPRLIILMEGGNDILRNHAQEQTKMNLATMISIAQGRGIEIILIGVPQKQLFSNSASFYQELADEYNLVFEGELLSDLLHSRSHKSDSIHLNNAGYRKFAEGIVELLKDNGGLD